MFTLYDGRTQLYQWDLNRKIIVEDTKICEVHFCNRTSDCSLVVEPYYIDNVYVADIPNILLQDARPIRVYAYCDDEYTLTEEQFSVKSRTRPADYVYEETDVLIVKDVLEKATLTLEQTTAALENSETALANANSAVDTANTANERAENAISDCETFANEAREAAERAESAADYYTKEDHATNYSGAKDVAYLTLPKSTYVRDATPEQNAMFNRLYSGEHLVIYVQASDLDGYNVADIKLFTGMMSLTLHYTEPFHKTTTTTTYVIYQKGEDAWTYRIDSTVTNQYTTIDDVSAKIEETVPALVEASKDVIYLDVQDINERTSTVDDYIASVIERIVNGEALCIYAKISSIEHLPTNIITYSSTHISINTVDVANNGTGDIGNYQYIFKKNGSVWTVQRNYENMPLLVTHQELTDALADIDVDLTGYATEDYVSQAIEAIVIPDVDLNGYATEEYVQEQINSIEIPTQDLTGYATEEYVNDAIANISVEDITIAMSDDGEGNVTFVGGTIPDGEEVQY